MDTEKTLQEFLKLWDRLPNLVGNDWATLGVQLTLLLSDLEETQDDAARTRLVGQIVRTLRDYPAARAALDEALKPPKVYRGGQKGGVLGIPPAEVEAASAPATRESNQPGVQNLLRRYVNVFLMPEGDAMPLSTTSSLTVGTSYELNLNIGPLSKNSVVTNALANAFPSQLLPQTEEGYWLEVIAVSAEFGLAEKRQDLFLPKVGASWVCDCPPGGTHVCTPETRRDYSVIPLTASAEPGKGTIRIGIYYAKNLIQSQLLTADVVGAHAAGAGRTGEGYASTIDYTLSASLSKLDFLPERQLHILTNLNSDGTHRIVVNGNQDNFISLNLGEGQIRATLDATREALRNIHFQTFPKPIGGIAPDPQNLLDKNNGKKKDDFVADMKRLAPLGWKLWTLFLQDKPSWREVLEKPATLQVSRMVGSTFVVPWALVYDIPLQTNTDYQVCPLLNDWDTLSNILAQGVRACPHEAEHDKKNFLCPFGFWGFKHYIEQPASMPEGRNLPTQIQVGNHPAQVVAAISLELQKKITDAHLLDMRTRLAQFNIITCDSLDKIVTAMANPVEVVYFYCHGKHVPLAGTDQETPLLQVGTAETFEPSDISVWTMADWSPDHWKNVSPLVFINGCHTTELEPELLVNFVDAFVAAYASGVIGTEITVDQSFASEAAVQFFSNLQAKEVGVGQALQQMRLHFVSKGNLLGLAYTPYCSVGLQFAGL